MIIHQIVDQIYKKEREIYRTTNRSSISLVIYIEYRMWQKMMGEIKTTGQYSSLESELLHTKGEKIMDHRMYRVLENDHGIVVIEKES